MSNEERESVNSPSSPVQGSASGAEVSRPSGRSFETALAELEERVRQIERGNLALEDALKAFEEGVALVEECQDRLDGAEKRIMELKSSSEVDSDPETSGTER
jgi:exodeoxyribonuclease VII small subunit